MDKKQAEKLQDGCVGCVFGRTMEGKSVCIGVEGVMPCLYFSVTEEPCREALKRRLTEEVAPLLTDGASLQCSTKSFSHMYGFEEDASQPSGRQVHAYHEVRYPSMRAFYQSRTLHNPKETEGVTLVGQEYFVNPVTRFLFEANITPGGWVRFTPQDVQERISSCDVECRADLHSFQTLEREESAPFGLF